MGEFNGKKRSELPDSVFGIPQERKYPMPDEKHTRSAIKLFNHVDPKYEEQLAKAVIKNMKKYGIDGSVVGPNNRLRKYLPKDMIKESTIIPPICSFEREPIHEYKPIPGSGILSVIKPISQKNKNDIQHIMNNLDGFEDFVFKNICFYDIERHNQTPIGFVILRKKPELHTAFVSIGVTEEYRGSGIGSKLLEKAISYFKSTKDLIWLEYWVGVNNQASIALAEKSGFTKYLSNNTSRSLGYYKYHMKNDNNLYEQIQESSNNKVYHLSQTNLDGKTIQPTVPSNYMTKNGYEDGKTKRVCFATSIDGCLRGLSLKCEGMKLFVHVPDGNYNIYKPSNKEVPDANITGEVWIKKAVKMKCIGQIYVIGDKGEDGIPYKYGDKTAELYDWEWKWIDKFNESYLLQEASIPEEIPNDIRELLRRLNSYDYGYIKDGKKIKGMKNFFEDYKSLTISEFEKYQIGVCWDYVHYEAYWFAKNHYKYETFYIQVQDEDNDCPSHTYLVFYLPNSSKVYYFESSWGKYQGIEAFDNIIKLHNTIKERHIESARSKCDPKTYFRNKYDAKSSRWEHLSCGDYMVKVSNGRIQLNESYIEEGYFKSTNNLEFNLDKWSKSGPHNLLYITEISGSGKTTLAKEMCKKYKAEYIELDKFTLGIVKGLDRWFEYVNNGTYEVHPLLKEYFSQLDHLTTNGSWLKPDMGNEHTKFLAWLINKVKGNGRLYIVEGAQFFMKLSNMDPGLIKGEPLIVVGTSAFKSWIRRIKRDTANDETISRFIYHLKKDVPMLFKYYFSNERDLQEYIKNMYVNEATNYTTQETGISTIIFDIGDVLIRDNFKKFLKSDPDIPNELVDTIKSLWFIAKDDVDDTMDLETYREIVNKRMGVEFSKYIPKLFQYGVDAVEVLDYTIPMIQNLKDKGYKVYYLSNWSAWTHDLLQEAGKFDFLKYMDGGVFSYDVGYRKPDPEIYQILLNRYKINPEEAVFFDDRKENIEAANKLGIYGVLFDKHDSAIVYNTLEQFHMSYQMEDVVDNSSTFTIHNYGSFAGQVYQRVQPTSNISKNHRYYGYDIVQDVVASCMNQDAGTSFQEYGTTGGTIVGTNQPDSVYIVNYMQNNVFSGHKEQKQAICKKGMNQMYTTKNGKSVPVDKNKFKEEASDVSVFRFKGSPFLSYDKIVESAIQDSDYYSLLTGDDISSPKYMKYDNRFIEEEPYTEYLDDITSCIESSIVGTQYSEEYPYMKVLTESVDGRCWNYYNDINGYFVMNELTGLRSPSYDSIEEIPESQIKVIERGTIYLGE